MLSQNRDSFGPSYICPIVVQDASKFSREKTSASESEGSEVAENKTNSYSFGNNVESEIPSDASGKASHAVINLKNIPIVKNLRCKKGVFQSYEIHNTEVDFGLRSKGLEKKSEVSKMVEEGDSERIFDDDNIIESIMFRRSGEEFKGYASKQDRGNPTFSNSVELQKLPSGCLADLLLKDLQPNLGFHTVNMYSKQLTDENHNIQSCPVQKTQLSKDMNTLDPHKRHQVSTDSGLGSSSDSVQTRSESTTSTIKEETSVCDDKNLIFDQHRSTIAQGVYIPRRRKTSRRNSVSERNQGVPSENLSSNWLLHKRPSASRLLSRRRKQAFSKVKESIGLLLSPANSKNSKKNEKCHYQNETNKVNLKHNGNVSSCNRWFERRNYNYPNDQIYEKLNISFNNPRNNCTKNVEHFIKTRYKNLGRDLPESALRYNSDGCSDSDNVKELPHSRYVNLRLNESSEVHSSSSSDFNVTSNYRSRPVPKKGILKKCSSVDSNVNTLDETNRKKKISYNLPPSIESSCGEYDSIEKYLVKDNVTEESKNNDLKSIAEKEVRDDVLPIMPEDSHLQSSITEENKSLDSYSDEIKRLDAITYENKTGENEFNEAPEFKLEEGYPVFQDEYEHEDSIETTMDANADISSMCSRGSIGSTKASFDCIKPNKYDTYLRNKSIELTLGNEVDSTVPYTKEIDINARIVSCRFKSGIPLATRYLKESKELLKSKESSTLKDLDNRLHTETDNKECELSEVVNLVEIKPEPTEVNNEELNNYESYCIVQRNEVMKKYTFGEEMNMKDGIKSEVSLNKMNNGELSTNLIKNKKMKLKLQSSRRPTVARGWRHKYEVVLSLVREPVRLLPESLVNELDMMRAKRQGYAIEKALVQANIDAWETTPRGEIRRRERPEHIRALYQQVATLDCMLTSLETQIEVVSAVHNSLPKEFQDTFHDSGTSGHEQDSLEAIHTLVGGGKEPSPGVKEAKRKKEEEGEEVGVKASRGVSEAGVLLHLERCAHRQTRRALQELKEKHEQLQQELRHRSRKGMAGGALESLHHEVEADMRSLESISSTSSDRLVDELKLREMTISQLRGRVLRLEKDRMDKVPVDAAREINRLNLQLIHLERVRDEVTLQNFTLKSRLSQVTNNIHDPTATYQINKEGPYSVHKTMILETKNMGRETSVDEPDVTKNLRKNTYKVTEQNTRMKEVCREYDKKELEYKDRIEQLEMELKNRVNMSQEGRSLRELEEMLEEAEKRREGMERYMEEKEEELNMLKLDVDTLTEENSSLKQRLGELLPREKELSILSATVKMNEDSLKKLVDENKMLSQDFNRERVLRKRYYNQIEDMKGKIRVFCRIRPMNEGERRRGGTVTSVEDEYSLSVSTNQRTDKSSTNHRTDKTSNNQRTDKSFVFDRIFDEDSSQEQIFKDTNNLIQSAMDGYNVTIMAYGQTGSGKTYTMIGTQNNPGIATRAFNRLFQLADDVKARQEVAIDCYMLELYNDKLIDLLNNNSEHERLEIKRDRKGSVHVQGSTVRHVTSPQQLQRVFEEGLNNRHTAHTHMNAESSRSHLMIVTTITATNRQNGAVLRGKLSLVDLAGSERLHKSGAKADTLRETNSINKSLSALGDVIAALSAEQSFVPYRNSKLTMLLQDSLGGNAKTLVFVNVTPAAYNAEESLISLMYASRIKQITNNASKNAETREISRLKAIISKLKRGEDAGDDSILTVC